MRENEKEYFQTLRAQGTAPLGDSLWASERNQMDFVYKVAIDAFTTATEKKASLSRTKKVRKDKCIFL
jgi:hypothetical protein